MKKYTLNPKETVLLETKPNTLDQARAKNRFLVWGTALLALLCWFFYYVMQSIPSFYPLLVLIGLIAMAGCAYYIFALAKGASGKSDEKYVITNVRIVINDNEGNIKKEITRNNIEKVVLEKVTGSTYDVVINPKEETNPVKLAKHKGNKTLYTSDTMILKAVEGEKVQKLLEKK